MKIYFNWSIQDGKLPPDAGRIVIFEGLSVHSNGPTRDHNDLITQLSARFRINRNDVASYANRFYWRRVQGGIIVSPTRKIDEDWTLRNPEEFTDIIKYEFK